MNYKVRRRAAVVNRSVSVIIVTGCNTLKEKGATFLAKAFPNAMVIGFSGYSTYYKGDFFPNFVKRLPKNLSFADAASTKNAQDALRDAWRKFIEDASVDKELSKRAHGSNGKWQNPAWSKPAYMMPGEKVTYWDDKTWKQRPYPVSSPATE
jgi:hypothetical protein